MSVATKLIVKAQEGHNFIDLYCKLAKELCRIHRGRFEFTKSEKFNEFQLCLVR